MIIICPSCGSDNNVKAVSIKDDGRPNRDNRWLHYKKVIARCDPCPKPLTEGLMTEFSINIHETKV